MMMIPIPCKQTYPAGAGINQHRQLGNIDKYDLPRRRGDKPKCDDDDLASVAPTPQARG